MWRARRCRPNSEPRELLRYHLKAPPGGEYVVGAVEAEWVPEGLTEEQFAKLAASYRRAVRQSLPGKG